MLHIDNGPLRFIESCGHYSIYHDRHGNEVLLGTNGIEVVDLCDIDLDDKWREWKRRSDSWLGKVGFLAWLQTFVTDDDIGYEIAFCGYCAEPTMKNDAYSTKWDGLVCPDCCSDEYIACYQCDELVVADHTTTTLADDSVCSSCRDYRYSYCDDCEGWYHDSNGDEHTHGECHSGCESPALDFQIRNDGQGLLANDERLTVSLPAGVISDEGLAAIRRAVHGHSINVLNQQVIAGEFERSSPEYYAVYEKWCNLQCEMDSLGTEWQKRDGNYTKRLSRMAYKDFGFKLPADLLSQIGNIASDHSRASEHRIEFTRDINQPAEAFGNEGSCWWGSYGSSRCALKSNGGLGIRSFADQPYYDDVTGRAWVLPLRRQPLVTDDIVLEPTFDTLTPDAFVVFNCYYELSGYTPARILAHMAGMTYRRISFTGEPMYVNSNVGYLVAPEEIASKFTDSSLRLQLDEHANLYETEQRSLINA